MKKHFIGMMTIQCKQFSIILFCLIIIQVNSIEANCTFEKDDLLMEERLIVAYWNDTYNLLRQNTVAEGTVLFMICGNDDIIELECRNGSFVSPLFAFPLEYCRKPVTPKYYPIAEDKAACPHEMYTVSYNVTLNSKMHQLELYRVCFDKSKMRAIYTANQVYPNLVPRPKNAQFGTDKLFTPFYFSAYSHREVIETFTELLGEGQVYMTASDTTKRIDRGHLMAAVDAMTNNMIRATFNMINVIPQFHSINAGNWKRLEEWVRKPFNNGSRVCSGAFDRILTLKSNDGRPVKMYLRDKQIPIPLWTYKIVRLPSKERIAFLQYNNVYDHKVPPTVPKEYNCQQIECPSSTLNLNNSDNTYGYTYCCKPNVFLQGRLKYLTKYC